MFCSLAGSKFDSIQWTNSDLLHTNFNGCRFTKVDFHSSDLYFSRMISAQFQSVDLKDCNLKRVMFQDTNLPNETVSMRYSNDEEAEWQWK
jgi:uncharacterized protein YjbI with pentapeptide repeats